MKLVEAIMQLCLPSNVEQHNILIYPYQGGKDLVIRGEREVLMEGALEKMEYRDQPLDCPVCITRAVYGDCGHC